MSNISPNPGELSAELVEALKAANSVAEMQEIQRAWLVEHGAERDRFSPDKLLFDKFKAPDAASGQSFTRTIKINGVDKVVVSDSELGLERAVGKAFQEAAAAGGTGGGDANANANAGTERSTMQARHPLTGQFVDPTNPANQAELKSLLVTGRITSEQYITAQPQLLDNVMKERYNLDPEKVEGERLRDGWAAATQEFLNSAAGADWPGGDQNKETLGKLLEANNRIDQPSVENLAEAFRLMRDNNLIVENPVLTTQKEISEATSFEDLRQSAWKSVGGRPSGFWAR